MKFKTKNKDNNNEEKEEEIEIIRKPRLTKKEEPIKIKKLIYGYVNNNCEYYNKSKKGLFGECHCLLIYNKLQRGQNIISCKGCDIGEKRLVRKRR